MGILSSMAMKSIIKANLNVYFDLVEKRGLDHDDALAEVLESRYPFEPGKKREVVNVLPIISSLNTVEGITTTPEKKEQLRDLISTMYFIETKQDVGDFFSLHMKYTEFIERYDGLYDSIEAKYH